MIITLCCCATAEVGSTMVWCPATSAFTIAICQLTYLPCVWLTSTCVNGELGVFFTDIDSIKTSKAAIKTQFFTTQATRRTSSFFFQATAGEANNVPSLQKVDFRPFKFQQFVLSLRFPPYLSFILISQNVC